MAFSTKIKEPHYLQGNVEVHSLHPDPLVMGPNQIKPPLRPGESFGKVARAMENSHSTSATIKTRVEEG